MRLLVVTINYYYYNEKLQHNKCFFTILTIIITNTGVSRELIYKTMLCLFVLKRKLHATSTVHEAFNMTVSLKVVIYPLNVIERITCPFPCLFSQLLPFYGYDLPWFPYSFHCVLCASALLHLHPFHAL